MKALRIQPNLVHKYIYMDSGKFHLKFETFYLLCCSEIGAQKKRLRKEADAKEWERNKVRAGIQML